MNIEITPEERKSILQYFVYIRSFGDNTGHSYYNFYYGDAEYESGVYAGNKKIEVFKPVQVVIDRILDKIDMDEFPEEFDSDNGYYNIDIDFDAKEKEIKVSGNFTINGTEDAFEEYGLHEHDLNSFDEYIKKGVSEIICAYDGGGDSGYINDDIGIDGERGRINASIENFCYDKLSNFRGWEINEGSQGNIVINLADKTVTVNHQWNTEVPFNFDIATIKI